jgi:hypothetical protein
MLREREREKKKKELSRLQSRAELEVQLRIGVQSVYWNIKKGGKIKDILSGTRRNRKAK